MKVYKGTDKNMQCQGKQYVLGKKEVDDGAIRCGDKGYHSCEAPFDVLRYYPNINGNRFFEAEAGGEIDKAENYDTKLASSESSFFVSSSVLSELLELVLLPVAFS